MANQAAALAPNLPKIGDAAPEFSLPADGDKTITLSELRGKQIALYFYPKDDTPGCTLEAQDFRDLKAEFDAADTIILGISKDSPASHDKFKAKFCLPFPLLSDTDGRICEAYGVWVEKSMYGKKYMGIERATFLIGKDQHIAHVWPKVKVEGHAKDVLETAKAIK